MYEIVRVGVPARKQDATKSFYDVVDDIKLGFSVGLITSDLNGFEKLSAPYGYNYLKTKLSDTDKFLYAEILEDGSSFVKCMSFKDALNDISWFSETEKLLTYGVYKQ